MFGKSLMLIGIVVTLSQTGWATDYYATPTGAGAGTGTSWSNAYSQSQIDGTPSVVDSVMMPGDVLHLGSGTYSQAIHLDSSGTASSHKRIIGESTGGGLPVMDMGNWSRIAPGVGTWSAIAFANAASFWTIENLVIQDVVYAIRPGSPFTGQHVGVTFRNLTIRNCEHALYIYDAKDWLIENINAREYAKQGIRFDHNCTDVIVRNCTADLSGGDATWYADAEQYPFGFFVETPGPGETPNSNIIFEDSLAQHNRTNKQTDSYWNGDGFVINQGNTGVFSFRRCRALDNEDGGFDVKADVAMIDCIAFQNKRGFRFWNGNSFMTNCVSGYPQKRGGCCSIDGVWVHDAFVTMNSCTLHASGADFGVEEDSAGQVTLNNCIVSFTGSTGIFASGSVTLGSGTVTYRPGAGADPQYVNPLPTWTGIGSNMNSNTYGASKGYFQDLDSNPAISDYQIVQTPAAPTIDGLVDSNWSSAIARTIGNIVVGSVAEDNDLSGSFRTLWDANNLYVLIEIKDQAQQNDSGSAQTWNDDSVEIYVDANNDKPSTYGNNDYQYRFTWNGTSLGILETKHSATAGVSASRIVTAGGYTIEVKLPWSTLAQNSAVAGAFLGLDVHVNDDDDGGARDGKRAWFNTVDTSWQNPSTFATAKLIGSPADHEIVQTATAPSIDGNIDSAWDSANSQVIANVVVGAVANDADLSGNFRTLWDSNNLYVLVQVTDDSQRNDSGAQTWNDDSVEIYIDANNDKPSIYGADDYQYRFTWTGSSLNVEETKHGATNGVTASRIAAGNGYTVEIKLPWSTLAESTVALGGLLGLDVHINDDDDGGSRDAKKAWFNTADTSWLNPSTFATARLAGIR